MTKLKEKLHENRYGLFFFLFLVAYTFIVSGDMQLWKVDDVTYSFHVVDLSMGFCTKLLPGEVCKLLFGEPTRNQVSVYLSVLIIICLLLVGLLVGKAFTRIEDKYRFPFLVFTMFFLTGPATFAVYVDMFCWLDFYWIFAAVLAVLCLQSRYTYILVFPLMFLAIMSHFASILCYVPFVAIFMLYKISVTENKKDKIYLSVIWWVTVIFSIGFSLYMMLNETKNVTVTAEEIKAYFDSLGIEDSRYYIFSFFRDKVEEMMPEYYLTQEAADTVLNIDMTQSPVKILYDTVVQQLFTNKAYGSVSGDLKHFVMISPVVVFIYKALSVVFRSNRKNLLKRFAIFCTGALFLFTLIAGYMLSTDTIRWISHALTPFFAMFLYIMYKEKDECKKQVFALFEKIPVTAVICYLAIYSVSINLF